MTREQIEKAARPLMEIGYDFDASKALARDCLIASGLAEWQSIETAPMDGSWILGFGSGVGIYHCVFVCGFDGYWEEVYSEVEVEPTYWMPLPGTPK